MVMVVGEHTFIVSREAKGEASGCNFLRLSYVILAVSFGLLLYAALYNCFYCFCLLRVWVSSDVSAIVFL